MVQAPTKRGYATTKRPCGATKTKTTGVYLVLRMVFPLEEQGFFFFIRVGAKGTEEW